MTVAPGDHVICVHDMLGGYGYVERMPVTVVRVGYRRVLIEARLRSGGTRQVWMQAENLRRQDGA